MRRTEMLLIAAAVAGILAGPMTGFAFAQNAATEPAAGAHEGPAAPVKLAEGRGQVILSWNEFVRITGYDPSNKGSQVLTIPWEEVERLLGVDRIERVGKGATVDLPWREFKALLEWSLRRSDAETAPPPTDFVVAHSEYAGVLSGEKAEFELSLEIEILREKGWKRIPVLTNDVAVTEADLPEGVYLNNNGSVYELLTSKSGRIEATVEFTAAVQSQAGVRRVQFQRVLPGSSVLDVTIDRDDVEVEAPGAQSWMTRDVEGVEHHVGALPHGTAVSVQWRRELPEAEPVPAKLYAETRTLVAVSEGLLLCDEQIDFNILHTPVSELTLQAPAGVSILTVSGANIRDWRVDDNGRLRVVLGSEAIGGYTLRLNYEATAADNVEAPVVRAVNVERERGYVGVAALTNVEIAAGDVKGATQVDVRRLPGDISAMTNQPILLGFRYVGEAFSIPLTVTRHEEVRVLVTIVDAAAYTSMQLADGRRITKAVLSVRNNRNQFLRVSLPDGAELWSVSVGGKPASPASEGGAVLIPLVRSASGSADLAAFPVELVYVETPAEAPAAEGTLRVDLPTFQAPVMHAMFSYYLPPEGEYTKPKGLFGRESGFGGPLQVVDEFASLSTGSGAAVVRHDAGRQVAQMEQQMQQRAAAEATAAGATPIRVRLPIHGKLFKLEKILALPGDDLYFTLTYSGWKD